MKKNTLNFGIVLSFLILLMLSLSCTSADDNQGASGDDADLFSLIILHTNDMHARVMEFNKYGNTCSDEESAEGKGFGGVARLATVIERERGDKSNVLLLDAGDQFQGTLFYSLFKGKAPQIFMNRFGYDAMTLGNHEFDDGPEVLAEFIEGLNFPVVSSSVNVANEPLLRELIKPYEILEVDGRKIGIVGFMTEEVPLIAKPGPNVAFEDIESSAQDAVNELISQDIDIIIALSHSGLSRDMETAANVEGIDVIVGAHTHSLLSNTDENAEGPYPVMVMSPLDEPVLIVTAKCWGKYLGEIEIDFNDEGIAEEWSGEPIFLDSTVPEDEEVMAEVAEMSGEVNLLRSMVIGNTLVDLDGTEDMVRYNEACLGNLIADAILWESRPSGAEIAFFNGGGIRAGIPAGDITMAAILEVLPFTDTIATLEMMGSDFRDLLEYSVSRAEDPRNEGTGRFLHFAGITFTWDPNQPAGSRILDVQVKNENGDFRELSDYDTYKIAASGFLRGGGDGFDILQEKAIDPYDFGRVISDVVVEYISLKSPLAPRVEGRIKRVE